MQRYMFFNSIDGDRRRYQAQDFAEYFGSVLSSGLLHTDEIPGMSVSVEAGTMNTVVTAGKAIMRGHLYENTAPVTLNHRIPEPTMDRIDRIVLRLDLRQSERNILLHVKEGESSTNPEPPPLQRDNTIYEISLAQIFVERNTSTLNPSNLTDERLDESVCGLVNSLLTVPTDQFVDEWNDFFSDKSAEIQQFADDYAQLLLDAENAFQNDRADFEQQFDDWFANQQTEGFVMANEKGEPGGIPVLDSGGTVPINQLPPMDYVPLSEKGNPNGVATLNGDGRVLNEQLGYYSPSDSLINDNFNDFHDYSRNITNYRVVAEIPIQEIGKYRVTGRVRVPNTNGLSQNTSLKITDENRTKDLSPIKVINQTAGSAPSVDFQLDMDKNFYPFGTDYVNLEVKVVTNEVNMYTYVENIAIRGSL